MTTGGEDYWRKFWNADPSAAANILREIQYFKKFEDWEVNLFESYFRNAIEFGAGMKKGEKKKK